MNKLCFVSIRRQLNKNTNSPILFDDGKDWPSSSQFHIQLEVNGVLQVVGVQYFIQKLLRRFFELHKWRCSRLVQSLCQYVLAVALVRVLTLSANMVGDELASGRMSQYQSLHDTCDKSRTSVVFPVTDFELLVIYSRLSRP